MPAVVETMAYAGAVPWHGLGVNVEDTISVPEMVKKAGLDWGVETREIYNKDGEVIPGHYALTRDSDDRVFDICGNRYIPVQNHQAFEFFREFVEAGDAKMETAGSLRDGKYVWGLANLGESFNVGKGKDKDTVKGYILVGCPHEQGKSLMIKFTPIRVVCNNTLAMAIRDSSSKSSRGVVMPEVRRSHRSAFDNGAVQVAKEQLGIAREQMHQFEEIANVLKKTKMNEQDHIDVLAPIFSSKHELEDIKSGKRPPRLQAILDALEKAPGADPHSAWGCLNGVTYWADHVAARSVDKRLQASWFGRTGNQKLQVMEALLA